VNLRRIANSNCIAWDVSSHDRTRTNHSVRAEANVAQRNRPGSELDAILHDRTPATRSGVAKCYAVPKNDVPTQHGVVIHDDPDTVVEAQTTPNNCLRP
jgi:hypothetical protein